MGNDIWGSIKGIVGKIAPVLGNAIVPGMGGVAGSILAGVLGTGNDPTEIEAALLNATPEQKQAIIAEANRHKERLIELGTENDKTFLQDRQNARQREIELVRATGKKDVNLYVLAWVVVVGFFLLVYTMMSETLPTENVGPINQLFGALAAGFGMVLAYFFGSSKGSADKTKLLAGGKE